MIHDTQGHVTPGTTYQLPAELEVLVEKPGLATSASRGHASGNGAIGMSLLVPMVSYVRHASCDIDRSVLNGINAELNSIPGWRGLR